MSYGTVAEADAALGHVPAWVALPDEAARQRALDTAALWLDATYELPSLGLPGVETAVKAAELAAVEVGLVTPLFPVPSATPERGVLVKERRRVEGVVDKEFQWAEPAGASSAGPVIIARVEAILRTIAPRRGAGAGRLVEAL